MRQKLNLKKTIIILMAVVIFFALTLTLFLHTYFDGERLSRLIVPQIEENLDREVEISEIRLKIWSGLGIEIDDFRIVNEKGFKNPYFAKFDSFGLDLVLWPLLRREVEIAEVSLIKPEIYLEADEKTNNYQFLLDLAAGEEDETDSSKLNLSLDNLAFKSGRIRYDDYYNGQEIELSGIDLETQLNLVAGILNSSGQLSITEIDLAGFVSDELELNELNFLLEQESEFDLTTGKAQFSKLDLAIADFSLSSKAEILLNDDGIDIKQLQAISGDSSLNLRAQLRQFNQPELDFDLQSNLDLAELIADLPLDLEPEVAGNIKLDLVGEVIKLTELEKRHDLVGEIELIDLFLTNSGLAAEIEELSALVSLDNEQIRVADVVLTTFASTIEANLEILKWQEFLNAAINSQEELPGQIDLDLFAQRLDLEQILDEFVATTENDTNNLESQLLLADDFYLPSADLTAKIEIAELAYNDYNYQLKNNFNLAKASFTNRLQITNPEKIKVDLTTSSDYQTVQQSKDLNDLRLLVGLDSKLDLARLKKEVDSFSEEFIAYDIKGDLVVELEAEFLLKELLQEEINDLRGFDLSGFFVVKAVEIAKEDLLEEPARLDLVAEFIDNTLSINDLSMSVADSDLAGTLKLNNWQDLALVLSGEKEELTEIELALNSENISIDKLLVLTEEFIDQEAETDIEAKYLETIKLLETFVADGSLTIKEIQFEDFKATELDLAFNFADLIAEVTDLSFNYAGGEVVTKIMANLDDQPSYYGDLEVSRVEVNQLLSQISSFSNHLYGAIDLSGEFAGAGLEWEASRDNLNLKSRAEIKDGRLEDWIIVDRLNQWFNIFSGDSLAFKDLTGKVNIIDGRLILDQFEADSKHGQIELAGSSSLAGELDYNLSYLLSKEATENISLTNKQFYFLNERELKLDFKLKGELNSPEFEWIKPDFSKELEEKKKDVQNKAEEEIDKQKEKIEEEIKDRIRGWF